MTRPIGIQHRRELGFRLADQSPDGRPVRLVTRASRWGNWYTLDDARRALVNPSVGFDRGLEGRYHKVKPRPIDLAQIAVELHRAHMHHLIMTRPGWFHDWLDPLIGCHLA